MSFEVILTPKFHSDIDYYYTKKKYRHIYNDVEAVVRQLEAGNLIGDPIPNLKCNNPTIKVRIANSDIHSGKSNGYRLIYYAITDDNEIYLLTIYSKKDDNNIPSNAEIIELINTYIN